jgi:hypothetical protein
MKNMRILETQIVIGIFLMAAAVRARYIYIHDETVWTKSSWDALKLTFPLEKLMQEEDLQIFELISNKGTFSKDALQRRREESRLQR